MTKKIIWLDCETSGLDKDRNGIISLAAMAEIEGKVVDSRTFTMNPVGRDLEDGALQVNGFTREQVASFKDWKAVKVEFCTWLDSFVSKFDKEDKATAAGYNIITFDLGFLESWFLACGDKYLYSYFDRFPLDVYRMVPMLEWSGLNNLPNRKLGTVCKALGVELVDAHEAMSDVVATRELAVTIRGKLYRDDEVMEKLVSDIFNAFEHDGWPGPDYIKEMILEALD